MGAYVASGIVLVVLIVTAKWGHLTICDVWRTMGGKGK